MKDSRGIVKKSNFFVRRARYYLPVRAQKLVQKLMSRVAPGDDDFKRYEFKISDLYDLLGFRKESYARRMKTLKDTVRILQRGIIEIPGVDEQGGDILMMPAWIETPVFNWRRGVLSLRLSERLKPFLLVDKNFVRWREVEFRRAYSYRFFEWCQDFQPRPDFYDFIKEGRYVKKEYFSLEELRAILGISDPEKYKTVDNFKKVVLVGSQSEIREKTGMVFDFRPVREGRRIVGYNLIFYGGVANGSGRRRDAAPVDGSLERRIDALGVSRNFRKTVFRKYDPEEIEISLEAVEEFQAALWKKGEGLKFPDLAFEKSLLGQWVSKREIARREEKRKTDEKTEAVEASRRLSEGLEKERIKKEKQAALVDRRLRREYRRECEIQRVEYEKKEDAGDKVDYILSLVEDYGSLNFDGWELIRGAVQVCVDKDMDFEAVKGAAIREVIEFMIPERIEKTPSAPN